MAENDDDFIRVSLGEEAELQIPRQDTHGLVRSYYDAKYPPQLREASRLLPEDTPETYLNRLLELYPDKAQQTYIRALYAVIPPGLYAPEAVVAYANNNQLDPKVSAVYPPELNRHLIGQGIGDKSLWHLGMDPAAKVEVIRANNLAEYALRSFGNRKVAEVKAGIISKIKDKADLEGLTLPMALKITLNRLKIDLYKNIMGEDALAQLVSDQVDAIVSIDSLQLSTGRAADAFGHIARSTSGEVKAIEIYGDVTYLAIQALDDLDIHPDVGQGLLDVFDRSFVHSMELPESDQ